jgi:uncharacterized protein YdeI (BOF family)
MYKILGLAALVVMLSISATTYALDPYYDPDQRFILDPQRYPSSSQILEGDVVRIDADSYIVRDLSGRETRVYFDRNTMRDSISVGDRVIVRYDRPAVPSTPYATSIVRRPADLRPGEPSVAIGVLPRPQTIEGEVLRIHSDNYVIRDLTGREVRLHVDRTTKLDGNLTPGDKVVARVVNPPADAPYTRTIYKINGGWAMEGQVVSVDGNTYVVRDLNGAEYRVYADPATMRDTNIVAGDRVVIVRGTTTMAHAESISKK